MDPWLGMFSYASGSGLCRESLMRSIDTERGFWYTISTYPFAAVSSSECDLSPVRTGLFGRVAPGLHETHW